MQRGRALPYGCARRFAARPDRLKTCHKTSQRSFLQEQASPAMLLSYLQPGLCWRAVGRNPPQSQAVNFSGGGKGEGIFNGRFLQALEPA